MRIRFSLRILGLLLMIFSSTMIFPMLIALSENGHTAFTFLNALALTFSSGLLIWLTSSGSKQELRIRDGFLITSLFWCVLGCFGSLPFYLSDALDLTLIESIFESISGLTTTGATVITGLDELPKSILFYRQLLQWLGGIGIIVVAVAILPMLGIGGMQLYKAETPGPSKDSKIAPRITETAKALFLVYLSLTLACALAYFVAGMTWFDAICHSFSTVAIGGFSTHDASMGFFNSHAILLVASIFMCISAINFGIHFIAWQRRSFQTYKADSETRFFCASLTLCVFITVGYLIFTATFSASESLIVGAFHAISIATTTGYATTSFSSWPGFLPVMLILFSFMGGCVGSTGGGMKAMRIMLILKQGIREMKQLLHPHAVIPLKIGKRRVEATVVSAVWSFFAVYTFAFVAIMLCLMGAGLDFITAFSSVTAAMNNLGPGLGDVSSNYKSVGGIAQGLLCFAMLLGRLEVFTLLVIFTPMFWRN